MDRCPACERKFKGIADYPLVRVISFERVRVPPEIKFPNYDSIHFFEPGFDPYLESLKQIRLAPKEVSDFFRQNKEAKCFEFRDWTWEVASELRKDNEDVKRGYRRLRDVRGQILSKIEPYLKKLESLVRQEVKKSEVLPPFQSNGDNFYAIPKTNYYDLSLSEPDNFQGSSELRKVILKIVEFGPGVCAVEGLAIVGKLGYEGRIKLEDKANVK